MLVLSSTTVSVCICRNIVVQGTVYTLQNTSYYSSRIYVTYVVIIVLSPDYLCETT